MDMAPRYSLNPKRRSGGSNYDDGDELMQMSEAHKYGHHPADAQGHGGSSRSRASPLSRASARSRNKGSSTRRDRRIDQVESYSDSSESESESESDSDESSSSEISNDARMDYEDDLDSSESDNDFVRHNNHNDVQFDNRSLVSNGMQSIAAQSVARAFNKTKNKGASRLSVQANLAMQRRKKESPKLRAKLTVSRDADYNEGATELYKHIENHRWREAAERCRNQPLETKIWVYRMDKKNDHTLWRMLPIHTAILYRAPVYVILDLIQAHPEGPSQVDDRKMLPVHMACRVICKEDVLRVLLKHKPDSVVAVDTKGRTPREIIMSDKTNEQESKVLKKVAARNKKNLLKVLGEFETIHNRLTSAHTVASNRFDDFDDNTIASRFSRRSVSRSVSRGVGGGSVASRSGSKSRSRSRSRSVSRPKSRESARSRSSRGRSRASSRPRTSSSGRAGYGNVPKPNYTPEDAASKRAPRLPTGPTGRAPRARSVARGRDDDDNMSVRSRVSRVPRRPRGNFGGDTDDDDVSRAHSRSSRVSRVSRAARGYDDDSVGTGAKSRRSTRSNSVARVRRQPRGGLEGTPNPLGINEISIAVEDNEDMSSDESEASKAYGENHSHGSRDSVEELMEVDVPKGPLYELWKDIETQFPVPIETFDPKIIQENEKQDAAKKVAREEAISKIKYYDPPKELQKLLAVISSGTPEASFQMKKNNKGKDGRAPLPEKGSARRVNACGALRALSKNAKNRLRLGRTKGVISCLLQVLRDESTTAEERARCSNTLMFLSVPKQNCEAIFLADPDILSSLMAGMQNEDPQVNYNCCYCLFLLSKSEGNRIEIASDVDMLKTLVEVADIGVEDTEDDEFDDFSVDGSLSQRFANLGSPSGIGQQGAPTTDEETKRGCRLSAMKVFLAVSKAKDGAHLMVSNRSLMNLLTKISGTMTAEENILCMAIFTNLSRNIENFEKLFDNSRLMDSIARGLASKSKECRRCATLTLQNLSCSKNFRRRIGPAEIALPGLAAQSLNSDGKTATESQLSALHTMRNLAVEPFNVLNLMNTPGLTASLMTAATDSKEEMAQYIACDTLAAMSQWLDSVADTCIEKNEINLNGRNLVSMRVSTWNQWE